MTCFTLDLEDYWLRGNAEVPLDRAVDRVLAAADDAHARGTVFVVGELAERRPDLVLRCRDAGHEIALHGYRHVPIDQLGPEAFADDVARGLTVLREIIGETVRGYRAPLFSVTPATAWAPAVLSELGLMYSSSILPARNPIRGFPGAPTGMFRWKDGIVEFPCPVGGPRVAAIPYLGGVYVRYLPMRAVRSFASRHADEQPLWLYCHPYDVDDTGVALDLPHAGRVTNWILGHRRRDAPSRIVSVLALGRESRPLGEVAASAAGLPVFAAVAATL